MAKTILLCVLAGIIAYALGNISPATIIGKIKGVDIRKEGSGNPGTTNVVRVLGLKLGLLTLAIDFLKAFIAVFIGQSIGGPYAAMVAFACVIIGHCYPVLYKFKGGKGVAAMLGAAMALSFPAAMAAIIIAVVLLLVTKKMSIGSIGAAVAFPFLIWFYIPEYIYAGVFAAVFIVLKHIPNIKRLKAGTEPDTDIIKKIKEMKNKSDE